MYNRESNGKIKLYLYVIWTVLTKNKTYGGLWKSNPDMFIISHLIIEIIIHQMITLLFYWFYKVFSCQCHFLLFLKYKCTIHNDTVFLMIYQKLNVHWKCCVQKCMSLKLDGISLQKYCKWNCPNGVLMTTGPLPPKFGWNKSFKQNKFNQVFHLIKIRSSTDDINFIALRPHMQ